MSFLETMGAVLRGGAGITPAVAFSNLKSAVSSAIGYNPDYFEMWVNTITEKIDLVVTVEGEKRKYPFADDRLMPLIKWGISSHLKVEGEIHNITLKVAGKNVVIDVYFEKDGQKDCFTQEYAL